MLVGIVGLSRLGREGLKAHLSKDGFWYASLLDEIRDMAVSQGVPPTPGRLLEFEIKSRQRLGATFFLQRALARLKGKHAIIDHIRHPEELAELRKWDDAMVVGLYSPSELKLSRELHKTREEHMRQFRLPKDYLASPEETLAAHLEACLAAVDVSIPYDTAMSDVLSRLDQAIEDLQLKAHRGPAYIWGSILGMFRGSFRNRRRKT